MATSRTLKLLPALVLVALALPSAAFGQATRTWVSGVGDDVNPCSRTAPCKTFAGAISKTARGGIINALDDGGFGTLTITKSITVDGGHHIASTLSSGGINGFNVNITDLVNDPGAKVVLRNLDIAGNASLGPPATTLGLNGVNILAAKKVKMQNVAIHNFSANAINMKPTTGVSKLVAVDVQAYDNGGNGLAVAPGTATTAVATLRRVDFDDNQCGVSAVQFGMGGVFTGNDCGAAAANANTGQAIINVFNSGFADNVNAGAFASGANSTIRLSDNNVMGSAFGLRQINSGVIKSFANNHFGNNGTDGVPNAPNLTPLKIAR
jgi:hypothetical protein